MPTVKRNGGLEEDALQDDLISPGAKKASRVKLRPGGHAATGHRQAHAGAHSSAKIGLPSGVVC
jgi:hypothetical protein